MICSGLQLEATYILVYARQQIRIDIVTVVDVSQVTNEIVQFHFLVRFDAAVVQVCVEHDDGEGEQKNGVGAPKLPDFLLIALAET
jgi:hypothetical protein